MTIQEEIKKIFDELRNSVRETLLHWGTPVMETLKGLLTEPAFWIFLFLVFVLTYFNGNRNRRTASLHRTAAKGVYKLIDDLAEILMGAINSILDAAGVLLNFVKELSSLLLGSLHEARVHRLAAFGVIFLSAVSFWTTSEGLKAFVRTPWNYLISFGVQSAILTVEFRFVKDLKLRKEIKTQILEKQADNEALERDLVFSWSNSLRVRFSKCLRKAEKIHSIASDPKRGSSDLVKASKKLVELFKSDEYILDLFDEHINIKQLSPQMSNLYSHMRHAAKHAVNEGEAYINAANAWILEYYSKVQAELEADIDALNGADSSDKLKKSIFSLLSDIGKQLNELKMSWQNYIVTPRITYWRSKQAVGSNSHDNQNNSKRVAAFRYSSGKVEMYPSKGHFIRLTIMLTIFIFLSSTFSYTYICNTNFSEKQDIENYHMTISLCDDIDRQFQENILLLSAGSKSTLADFIKTVQQTAVFGQSSNAYTNYYNEKKKALEKQSSIEELREESPNYSMDRLLLDNDLKSIENSIAQYEKEKTLYLEYLAFMEIYCRTDLASNILNNKLAPDAPTSEDENYIQHLKEYDLASVIWVNKGLIPTVENIIAQLLLEEPDEDWSNVRARTLVYQNVCEAMDLFDGHIDSMKKIMAGTETEAVKSQKALQETKSTANEILQKFMSIGEEDTVAFCSNLYESIDKIGQQERFINEKTSDVENALIRISSKYVPKTIPVFCWFIALLIDLSTFLILMIRGVKNRAHILDKHKVLLARMLLRTNDINNNELPIGISWVIKICVPIVSFIIICFVPFFSGRQALWFFCLWYLLYIFTSAFSNLIINGFCQEKEEISDDYRKINHLIDTYYPHFAELIERNFGNVDKQIETCNKYKDLLIEQLPKYKAQIEHSFQLLQDRIQQGLFPDALSTKDYIVGLRYNFVYRIQENIFERYFNDMCMEFLSSLQVSDTKEYGGFNYLFHKALDKCDDRAQLFSIYYESLYPTLFYISYATAKQKGLEKFIQILIAEDLAYYDEDNVYIAPLMFRELDEVLFLKMLNDDFDFTAGSNIDTDMGMDDIIDAYVEAKYSNLHQ